MSYRCNILGHDYREAEIEREEDRRENAIVTRVREVETCRRCGDRNIVTEYPITTPLEAPEEDTAESGEETVEDEDAGEEPSADSGSLQYREENTLTEYACSECGFVVEPDESPLQAGDLCPECHQSYLTADI